MWFHRNKMSQTEKITQLEIVPSPNRQRGDNSEIFFFFLCFAGSFHKLLSERQKYLGGVRRADVRVIRGRRPQTLHSWNRVCAENSLCGGWRRRMGLPRYPTTKRRRSTEACSLLCSHLSLFMSRRRGTRRRRRSQLGILLMAL